MDTSVHSSLQRPFYELNLKQYFRYNLDAKSERFRLEGTIPIKNCDYLFIIPAPVDFSVS